MINQGLFHAQAMHRFAKVMLLRTFNPAMFPQWLYQLYFWALYVTIFVNNRTPIFTRPLLAEPPKEQL